MWILLTAALCIALLRSGDANFAEHEQNQKQEMLKRNIQTSNYTHYRLPNALKPTAYTLKIITQLNDTVKGNEVFTFNGAVVIHFKVLENTQNITLHSRNLDINESQTKLTNVHSDELKNCIKSTERNLKLDYYIMQLCEPIKKDEEYSLRLSFKAPLSNTMDGYYKSSYFDKQSNQTHWLAVTQFEPASARAAFPCFDEPSYKATFKVILGHHEDYRALSNMPVKSSEVLTQYPHWVWTEFEQSVPMSTYLVAYTVNDFYYTESNVTSQNGVQFRTWARRDAIDQCNFSTIVGPKLLKFFEETFKLEFPLTKIDQIAIPDFLSKGMENWGLIVYSEDAILYSELQSAQTQKNFVTTIIAHELAHQWFGNLVTMNWWTDLWLNEGFATYVQSIATEYVIPNFKSKLEESVTHILFIFQIDALKHSRSIRQPVHAVYEMIEMFDHITYLKGSIILSMMHTFLGDEAFRLGIHNYLKEYAYKNAEQDNLWASLTVAALQYHSIPENYDIKRIMDSWTLQSGYPLIIVTRDYNQSTVTITQEQYLLDREESRRDDQKCWWVPLSFTTKTGANFNKTTSQHWLECDTRNSNNVVSKIIKLGNHKDEWIIFNLQMSGLYKVKYDEHNWKLLIETLMSNDFNQIHLINRAQLIEDAFSLAWSGDQDYDIAIRLLDYLEREIEYIPWKIALDNLGKLHTILKFTSEYGSLKNISTKYIKKIITPMYLKLNGLNVTTDKTISMEHKILIGDWACSFNVEDCVSCAQEYFVKWQQSSDPDEDNPVPFDLRPVVYCNAIRHGGEDEWQFLWTRFKNSNVANEKNLMLNGLGCSREVWLLQRLLEWSFNESSGIRTQESLTSITAIADNAIGSSLLKTYFISNFDFVYSFYKGSIFESYFFTAVTKQISNKRDYNDLKIFLEQKIPDNNFNIAQNLEKVKLRVQWKERNLEKFSQILKSRF